MPQEEFQTVREVADLLKVNEATVRRWIRNGELRAIEIGKGWRIGSRDLDTFLDDHATRPVGETGEESTTASESDALSAPARSPKGSRP